MPLFELNLAGSRFPDDLPNERAKVRFVPDLRYRGGADLQAGVGDHYGLPRRTSACRTRSGHTSLGHSRYEVCLPSRRIPNYWGPTTMSSARSSRNC